MYDLVIIGGGPVGYRAAKRAARLGASVCLIEKEDFGGVCLNKGCVPTKFLVNTAEVFSNIKRSTQFGIDVENYALNIDKAHERKNSIIEKHRAAIERLFDKSKVKVIKGQATLKDKNTVTVLGEDIQTKYILIATGSVPIETASLKFDHKNIISSADILNLNEVPSSLIIVGAGYIGCEFACIYREFGSEVTLVELQPQIIPGQDIEIAKKLGQSMKKKGIKILLNTKIKSLTSENSKVEAILEDGQTLEAQKALLTIGRKPNIDKLGLKTAGVDTKDNAIVVNDKLQTNAENIYAAGDVIGGFCLAYTAFYEGDLVAENIFGKAEPLDYGVVPSCIFTIPEIASVGLTAQQAKEQGNDVVVGSYPFMASSKAHILNSTEGMVKLITDVKSNRILGAQIFGSDACELIHELVVALGNNMTAKDLSHTLHAHPTLAESIQEAARSAT